MYQSFHPELRLQNNGAERRRQTRENMDNNHPGVLAEYRRRVCFGRKLVRLLERAEGGLSKWE